MPSIIPPPPTLLIVLLLSLATTNLAFAPRPSSATTDASTCTSLQVKLEGNKWVPETDEERPEAGYGILNTIVRHGPTPAVRRLFQPDQYEQAVLKFMAQEGCDRNAAQGNMDYYFRNPDDWFALRMEEERLGIKTDLVTVNPIRIILVAVWTGLLALFVQQFLARVLSGEIDFSKNHQFDFLRDLLSFIS